MSDEKMLDLDSMLEDTLDTIEEMPDYLNPPTGVYMLAVAKAPEIKKYKQDDGSERQSISLTLSVAETVETEETPVPDGTLFTQNFQGTEKGLSALKRDARKILDVENLDGVSLRDIFGALEAAEPFKAKISYRSYKGQDGLVKEAMRLNVM